MPKTVSREKYETIVQGAGRVFALVGYNRAMMSDIAEEAGVALGTLYRYAETKEELFELALREGLGEPALPVWEVHGREFQDTVFELTRSRLRYEELMPSLVSALRTPAPPDCAVEELRRIAGEAYDVLDRFRIPIRMLDRSSADWPELSAVFADELRAPFATAVTSYLTSQCRGGGLRRPPHIPAAARLIVETLTTHAMHRHFSPGGPWVDNTTARRTALHAVTAMFEP